MARSKGLEPSLQQRLEAKNHVLNKIDQLMDRWEQRVTLSNIRLADRRLNFGLNVLLHVRFDSGEIGVVCFEQIGALKPVGSK